MTVASPRTLLLALACAGLLGSVAQAEEPAAEQPPAVEASPAPQQPQAAAPEPAAEAAPAPAAEPQAPAAAEATPPAPQAAVPAARTVGKNTLSAPAEGMAQLVFYRPSRLGGMALSFSVREDGKGVGKLGNGSYFVVDAVPGVHTYTIESEATDKLTLEVDAGETYYVEQTIGMGIMMGRPHLAPSTAEAFGAKALKLSTKKPTDDRSLAVNSAKETAPATAQ